MIDAGYDDIDSLLYQMHTSYPINRDELERVGITAPGHQYRIIIKLEEDSGICPRRLTLKSRGFSTDSF